MKAKTMSKGFTKLSEGRALNIDKDILGDQKTLEVGKELPKSTKIEKEDKQSFEDFKYVYKSNIDARCLETYGVTDDKDLWEDTAKEMYLTTKNYIPDESKNDGELSIKTESKNNISDTKIKKTIKEVIDENNGIFTDDSIYDVVEKLTGITDLDKMSKDLCQRVRQVYDKFKLNEADTNDYNDFLDLGNDVYAAFEMADFDKDTFVAENVQDVIDKLTDNQRTFLDWLVNKAAGTDGKIDNIVKYLTKDFSIDDYVSTYAQGYIDDYQKNAKNPNLFDYFDKFLYEHIGNDSYGEYSEQITENKSKECS